jgi:hypothetical protein
LGVLEQATSFTLPKAFAGRDFVLTVAEAATYRSTWT